jgi:hypothetical protein
MPRSSDTKSGAERRRNQPAPRTDAQVLAELRGLGGLVLEQALLDGDTKPLKSLLDWFERLAQELGVAEPPRAKNYRELLKSIVSVSRLAGGDPAAVTAA